MCNDIRRNLVAVGDNESERPSLATVSAEIVTGLRRQVRHVSGLLEKDADNERLVGRLIALGNTASKVLEAARKLQVDGRDAVDAMSFGERAELFLEWYMDLPPPYRVKLRAQMADHEIAIQAPVSLQLPRATND